MRVTSNLALEPRFGVGRGDSSRRGDAVEVGPQAKLSQRASGAASRASGAPIRAARSARFAPHSPGFFEAKPPTALEAAQKVWRDYLEAERSGRTEKAAWPSRRHDIEEVRLAGLQRGARLWIFCLLMCSPFVLCLRYYETRTYKGLRGGVRRVPVERSTAAPAAVEVSSEAGSFTEDVAVTATLWRRVRDGVKRVAKRPRQSDSSITTRSRGKKHKKSGTEREKRARASADDAVDQARRKKRHRAARNAVTMMDIDVKSKKPTFAPTPVPSAVPTVSPKPSSSPTPAPSAYPTVSPQPTVSPLPTSAPTITPGPTVSPQPTYWPWKRPCHLGPQRNERCTPTADQLHANVKRTEGVIAQSCDHRPDATLEEKNAAFQANADKLTYVVATGVADSRRVRQNHFPSLYAPCRSIRTCPSRRRTGFLLIISISYPPTTCAARLHITNSHGPAAVRSRSSLRCTTRPSWTTSTSLSYLTLTRIILRTTWPT